MKLLIAPDEIESDEIESDKTESEGFECTVNYLITQFGKDNIDENALLPYVEQVRNMVSKHDDISNLMLLLPDKKTWYCQPKCIIQRVHYSALQKMRKSHFSLKHSLKIIRSNPLLFRRELSEFKQGINAFHDFSLPIIFIGDFALFYRPGFEPLKKNGCLNDQVERHSTHLKLPERIYPPGGGYKLFLDSSIWHHYVPVWEINRLPDVINEIEKLSVLRIYETTVALEDLDYSIRMLRNQYVEDFVQGHGRHISVHAFHSEAQAKSTVESFNKNERQYPPSFKSKNGIGFGVNKFASLDAKEKNQMLREDNDAAKTQVRILLVDDFSDIPLRLCNNIKSQDPSITKKECVKRLFSLSGLKAIQIDLKLSTASTIEGALEKIKNQRYDIILLDYLFTINANGSALSMPSYGSEFLKKLVAMKDEKDAKLKKGPGDHFWIMPATVFPEAIRSEVESANISQEEAEYTLFSGADPVCTPELFKYKFLKMVETIKREIIPSLDPFFCLLENLGIRKKELCNTTLLSSEVRSKCRKAFHRIVNQCARYTQLQEDKNDSLLATSLLELDQDILLVGELLVRIRSFLNDFVFGGDQKWGTLHLEFNYISRHPLLIENKKAKPEIKAGLEILLDEINKKAERG